MGIGRLLKARDSQRQDSSASSSSAAEGRKVPECPPPMSVHAVKEGVGPSVGALLGSRLERRRTCEAGNIVLKYCFSLSSGWAKGNGRSSSRSQPCVFQGPQCPPS